MPADSARSGAACWPRAEAAADRHTGSGAAGLGRRAVHAFQQALRDLGYRDDNTVIEGRWADGDVERLPGLVRLSPDVIVALSGIATPALKRATTTIPIVFAISDDPVGQGLVASLAHPGGNATGMSFAQEDTVGKQLQLLETMAPVARRVAVLTNPNAPAARNVLRALQRATASLPTALIIVEAGAPAAIEPAFARMQERHAGALLVLGDGLFTSERRQIIALAASHRLPAIYHDRIFVE